ncbi:MAG: gluconate 2-dehydrogenase subunit 3 family protein [Chromatiaceae bacterium]|nr:gluconate 2-dehydrogenase subunit 3 family protein [Gammaproteobacteria bacterium]MCP5301054.1 gluconate 2-dehydrogenase subunit 3 family protein [Chromatiaceae bacterium]MCP5421474.1 gluconate 2-dehydrogenase subunit 3 family protein [Chromatiaceae bacterium]
MIRRGRPQPRAPRNADDLRAARALLLDRRRFLIAAAGGTVALLFGLDRVAQADDYDPWPTLDAVSRHLLPSEPGSPGAADINAVGYLRFVATDPWIDAQDRAFLLDGNRWLDELAQARHARSFNTLDDAQREQLLRQVAATPAGENWLSTLISYLLEALLTAPAYGGNPDGIGWRWLEYVPGFPLPDAGTRYRELPL